MSGRLVVMHTYSYYFSLSLSLSRTNGVIPLQSAGVATPIATLSTASVASTSVRDPVDISVTW